MCALVVELTWVCPVRWCDVGDYQSLLVTSWPWTPNIKRANRLSQAHSMRIVGFLLWRRSHEGKPCWAHFFVISNLILDPWRYQKTSCNFYFQRSRAEQAQKAEAEYRKLLAQRAKDAKEKKKERRRSSLSKSANSVSSNWSDHTRLLQDVNQNILFYISF